MIKNKKDVISRAFSVTVILSLCLTAVPPRAALYADRVSTGTGTAGTAVPLFPGLLFGDSADHLASIVGLTAILAAVNEFFDKPEQGERREMVASLYGSEGASSVETPDGPNTESSISVVVRGNAPNQAPIQVFTGTDTSRIMSQLFSGILNIDEETFVRRRDREVTVAPPPSGGRAGELSRRGAVTGGNFLATQELGASGGWIESNAIRYDFDQALPSYEIRDPPKTSQLIKFVLSLLNPYFYGALFLLLLFAIAWSLRSRFLSDEDVEI